MTTTENSETNKTMIMTTTTIMTALFAVAAALLGRSRVINHRLHRNNERLRERLRAAKDADGCPYAYYHIGVAPVGGETFPAVIRQVTMDGKCHRSVIRVFDTGDCDYDANAATELAEKLNESLCYD